MKPWDLPGPHSSGHQAPSLTQALRLLHTAERRVPTDADRPPVSVFPSTPGSRAARAYDRERALLVRKAAS